MSKIVPGGINLRTYVHIPLKWTGFQLDLGFLPPSSYWLISAVHSLGTIFGRFGFDESTNK